MSNRPGKPAEAEPFLLLSNKKTSAVTNEDLSQQIGALSSHLVVVHEEVALARADSAHAREAATSANDAINELRSLVLGDHAPRISKVEERASRLSIPPGVKRGAVKGVGYAGLVSLVPIIQQLWPLIEKALAK